MSAEVDSNDQPMSVGVTVGWDSRAIIVLRCAACDNESRATDSAFLSWEWPSNVVDLASITATAEAHRREQHGEAP